MWELKIHVILYLLQIYFLTKYLLENAENSISETLDLKISGGACPQTPLEARAFGARSCEHHLKNSIFLSPPSLSFQITLCRPYETTTNDHLQYLSPSMEKPREDESFTLFFFKTHFYISTTEKGKSGLIL